MLVASSEKARDCVRDDSRYIFWACCLIQCNGNEPAGRRRYEFEPNVNGARPASRDGRYSFKINVRGDASHAGMLAQSQEWLCHDKRAGRCVSFWSRVQVFFRFFR
jgi:hypothetical protein